MRHHLVVRDRGDEAVCLVSVREPTPTMLTALSMQLGCGPLFYKKERDAISKTEWDTYREITGLPALRAISHHVGTVLRWTVYDYSDHHDAVAGQ